MTWREFLSIVEIRTKIVSISSFCLGTLYAAWATGRFSPLRASVMLAATLAVDMGTTAWNSYFDYLHGVDDARINRESDKVLVHGRLPPAAAFWSAAALFAAAVGLGLWLSFLAGFWVAAAGALCMAAGFLYNAGPLPLSRTPLGELAAGGFLGSALFLISFGVQAGAPAAAMEASSAAAAMEASSAAAASLPGTLLIASILTVNNTCDRLGDREAGRRTLSILIGHRASELLIYLLGLCAWALTIAFGLKGLMPGSVALAAAAGVPPMILLYRRMHARGFSQSVKGPQMQSILALFTLYSAAAALGLGAALFLR